MHTAPIELATRPVAALYVDPTGAYANQPGVETWGEDRDARNYRGPWPVVAHPECKRWGKFWHGSTRKPHQFRLGEDGGMFAAALTSVRNYGGVLEHPSASKAWAYFGLRHPKRGGGWIKADDFGGWTCCVDQRHYGHFARKETWLYAAGVELPELVWSAAPQVIPQWMIDRYGYKKARRTGLIAMVGGKDKERIRAATPEPFRDLLLSMARSVAIRGNERTPAAEPAPVAETSQSSDGEHPNTTGEVGYER